MESLHRTEPELTGILSLPPEILVQIWKYLLPTELKSLRLSCKSNNRTTAPTLFRQVTVYPHTQSINSLAQLAAATHLCSHVCVIIYDSMLRHTLQQCMDSGFDADLRSEHQGQPIDGLPMHEICSESITGHSHLDQLSLLLSLQGIFPKLTNLGTICIRGNIDREDEAAIPQFYASLLGKLRTAHVQSLAHSSVSSNFINLHDMDLWTIMTAALSLKNPLHSLEVYGEHWDSWHYGNTLLKVAHRYKHLLAGLKHLSLATHNKWLYRPAKWMAQSQTLLKLASSLASLKLIFKYCLEDVSIAMDAQGVLCDQKSRTRLRSDFTLTHTEDLWSGVVRAQGAEPRFTWSSKIKYLELRGLTCKSNELQAVLTHCSATLTSFALTDLVLLPAKDDRGKPRACLVHFLKWMQAHLKLNTVSLTGIFTNCGAQYWQISEWYRSGLRREVGDFIVNGGICPLDHVQIQPHHYDLGKKKPTDKLPDFLEDDTFFGDLGWRMYYVEIETIHYDGDDGDSSTGSLASPIEEVYMSDFDPDEEDDDDDDDGETPPY